MSGLAIRWPNNLAGPVTTARCGSQRMIRAPIETSLSTKNSRFSNIFSKIRTVPWACVATASRSEEHTSELQSLRHLVCRLLLEKKKEIKPLQQDYTMENSQ